MQGFRQSVDETQVTSAGATELTALLSALAPQLTEDRWVFCTADQLPISGDVEPLMTFREAEGITFIVRQDIAESLGSKRSGVYRQITLGVHSSLEAIGLTGVVCSALAAKGVSCNVVAAYFHDHLFVPEAEAHRALDVLRAVSQSASQICKTL